MRAFTIWALLLAAILLPLGAALASPLLAWRDPIYIGAGVAGILAMATLLLQPLLAAGFLPGLKGLRGRRIHRLTGTFLILAIVLHVLGLWITSPPDVIDALLFVSPTPFSVWGVIAMWAAFASAFLVALRARLRWRPRKWQLTHTSLALIIVVCSVLHAMLIEGTMEMMTKTALSALVLLFTLKAVARVWRRRR